MNVVIIFTFASFCSIHMVSPFSLSSSLHPLSLSLPSLPPLPLHLHLRLIPLHLIFIIPVSSPQSFGLFLFFLLLPSYFLLRTSYFLLSLVLSCHISGLFTSYLSNLSTDCVLVTLTDYFFSSYSLFSSQQLTP